MLYLVREASYSSRWEQMWKPTARHYVERESKLGVSIKALPSEHMRDSKGMDLEQRGGMEELGGEEEGESIIRMYFMRKESTIKQKILKKERERENLHFKDRIVTSNFKLENLQPR